jgi:hypothetical protein
MRGPHVADFGICGALLITQGASTLRPEGPAYQNPPFQQRVEFAENLEVRRGRYMKSLSMRPFLAGGLACNSSECSVFSVVNLLFPISEISHTGTFRLSHPTVTCALPYPRVES